MTIQNVFSKLVSYLVRGPETLGSVAYEALELLREGESERAVRLLLRYRCNWTSPSGFSKPELPDFLRAATVLSRALISLNRHVESVSILKCLMEKPELDFGRTTILTELDYALCKLHLMSAHCRRLALFVYHEHLYLVRQFLARSMFDQAEAACRRALSLAVQDNSASILLCEVIFSSGRRLEAMDTAVDLLAGRPRDVLRLFRANAPCVVAAGPVLSREETGKLCFLRGRAQLALGNLEESAVELELARSKLEAAPERLGVAEAPSQAAAAASEASHRAHPVAA